MTDLLADSLATRSYFDLEFEPELAESWEISDDGTTDHLYAP